MEKISRVKIVMLESVFEQIKEALRWDKGDEMERAVYLLCHRTHYGSHLKLMPYLVIVPEEKDYVSRSAGHCKLDKPFINKAINMAIADQADMILTHIHPPDFPAEFSWIDDEGDRRLMGHIADDVEGIGQGALVFGNSMDTIDSRFYDHRKKDFIPVDKLVVVGKKRLQVFVPWRSLMLEEQVRPTLSKIDRINSESLLTKIINISSRLFRRKWHDTSGVLDRTIKVFGKDAVKLLGFLDVGVVGASALGGPILEMLGRDRVNSITLCDPDIIEETNLNRLPATCASDIGKPKVAHYSDYLSLIAPEIPVTAIQKSFYDHEAQSAFSYVDVIIGCVDSVARFSINQLACANLIPYFDLGAAIVVESGKPSLIGGQVYSIIPGREVCLLCAGVFGNLRNDYLSPSHKEKEIERGFIKSDEDIAKPLTMFLDYTIAGIGYHQMLKYIWGYDDVGLFSVHYDGVKNRMVPVTCERTGCMVCLPTAWLGMGDKVPAKVPAVDRIPGANDSVPRIEASDNTNTSNPHALCGHNEG